MDRKQIETLRSVWQRPEPGRQPIEVLHEKESADREGKIAKVLTVFLRGSECRFRCTMCDLWKTTHIQATQSGDIEHQVRSAVGLAPSAQWIKLYNASNFFDPHNIPSADLLAIPTLLSRFDRVIVENHPRIQPRDEIRRFRDALPGHLEVAMGLETSNASVLQRLNKSMDLDDFRQAAELYQEYSVDLRVFVLLQPPWIEREQAIQECLDSIQFAIQCGARHVSIIPTRGGNGAMEWLQSQGHFSPPAAGALERVFELALKRYEKVVITIDLWNWNQLAGHCQVCCSDRLARLERMNLNQRWVPETTRRCSCIPS